MTPTARPISKLKPGWGWDTPHPLLPGWGNHPDAAGDPTVEEMQRMDTENNEGDDQ